jgi:hypothetical protein
VINFENGFPIRRYLGGKAVMLVVIYHPLEFIINILLGPEARTGTAPGANSAR